MRKKIITCLLAAGTLLSAGLTQSVEAKQDPVFADGGVLAGSTNGLSFGPDGTLWVANVFGSTITQIDPESGAIISQLTAADSVFFPDDVIVASNGDIYWTEIALGNVFKKPVGEPAFPLLPGLFVTPGLNSANPLTLSDDETRLFAAGCYGAPPLNNDFVEIDPVNGGIVNTLRSNVEGCASNGMSWNEGFLYAPQPFEDSILRIDPDNGDIEVVTEDWPVPIGTAFDSQGDLYALAQGVGEVVKIDIDNTDTQNNRTVIAEIPVAWADNIAINDDDRIFISSATDSSISEVLADGSLRTVVPGQFQLTLGVNVIGDILYSTHPSGIVSYDRRTGELIDHYRAAFGVSGFPFALSSVVWGDNLVLMSAFNGDIVLWDPVANEPLADGLLPGPIDAQPFENDLIVTTATGEIFRVDESFTVLDVVANVPGSTGLAAKGGDVWVADHPNGTVLQIIDDGVTLEEPVVAFGDLAGPEGLDIRNNRLFVVEGASGTLTSIHLKSGKRKTVGTDLGFQAPFFFAFGYLNNVTVARNDIYVNADRANVIYEF